MIISDFDLLTSQQFSLSNPTNLIKEIPKPIMLNLILKNG